MVRTRPRQRGTLREEQKAATRARLLVAGREVFEEFGYAAATVDEITDRIGASRGTFYFYFSGKSEIMAEIATGLVMKSGPLCVSLDEAVASGSTDELRAWVRNTIEVQTEYRKFNIAYEEACAIDPEIRKLAVQSLTLAADSMSVYLSQFPEPLRKQRRLRVEFLILMLERFFYRWSIQETFPAVDLDAAIDELAALFAAALMS
jgi:AcrR family transcriptional regulator